MRARTLLMLYRTGPTGWGGADVGDGDASARYSTRAAAAVLAGGAHLAEERHDARLLSGAGGPVEEQVAHLVDIFLVRHAPQLRRQLLRTTRGGRVSGRAGKGDGHREGGATQDTQSGAVIAHTSRKAYLVVVELVELVRPVLVDPQHLVEL